LWSIEQAQHRPDLERLGYFGSYARGDWGVGSDLDLIAVITQTSDPFERRNLKWDLDDLPVPAEILVYSIKEWIAIRKRCNIFSRMLNNEVIWTYSRNS